MDLVTLDDVRAAAADIAPTVLRTPLLRARWDDSCGSSRRACNRSARSSCAARPTRSPGSTRPERARGVVTHSSGNHGQALAYAARAAGVPCTVVVPDGAPEVKIDRMRAFGARCCWSRRRERLAEAQRIAAEYGPVAGAALRRPADHRRPGHRRLEIVDDLPDVDVVLVPVGGGGLASGVATAVKALRPSTAVIGVEPELAADARESLAAGGWWPGAWS